MKRAVVNSPGRSVNAERLPRRPGIRQRFAAIDYEGVLDRRVGIEEKGPPAVRLLLHRNPTAGQVQFDALGIRGPNRNIHKYGGTNPV